MFEHRVLTYNGCRLDRAMDNRCKPEWLADRLARSDRRMVASWQDRCLLLSGKAMNPGNAGIPTLPDGDMETVFLGLDGDTPVFAIDLSALPQADALAVAAADAAVDLRGLVGRLTGSEGLFR